MQGFPGSAVVKNLPVNAGDTGSILGLGRSPEGGSGNPLQYSCLENPMDRRAWRVTALGVTKSGTQLSSRHGHEQRLEGPGRESCAHAPGDWERPLLAHLCVPRPETPQVSEFQVSLGSYYITGT